MEFRDGSVDEKLVVNLRKAWKFYSKQPYNYGGRLSESSEDCPIC